MFICYFVAPFIVRLFMGANDAVYGGITFSLLIQAGLGIAFAYKLFGLKPELNLELAVRLSKFSQPPEKAQELAEKISLAAGFIIIAAIVWPTVGEMVKNRQLTALIKIFALGYAVYLGYNIWKLSEPFMASARAGALNAPT